ncbi:hypothetical protein ACOME3_003842 [Neoechinorhynchus agilis]
MNGKPESDYIRGPRYYKGTSEPGIVFSGEKIDTYYIPTCELNKLIKEGKSLSSKKDELDNLKTLESFSDPNTYRKKEYQCKKSKNDEDAKEDFEALLNEHSKLNLAMSSGVLYEEHQDIENGEFNVKKLRNLTDDLIIENALNKIIGQIECEFRRKLAQIN